jgi:hypothetical protein
MEEKEFNYKLREIGRACGKIACDIVELYKNCFGDILFIVPLRGGLPIWKGVAYGLYKKLGCLEVNVAFLPASSTVEKRDDFVKESMSSLLKKLYPKEKYKRIVIVDEAISGSSSKMVLDKVKDGIKSYKPEKEWKRYYWRELPIELYLVVAHEGKKLNPRIQKMSNVLIYPVQGNIITTDNSEIYPMEYLAEIGEKSKDGKLYRFFSPDVVFKKNEIWGKVVKEIEAGVDQFFESFSNSTSAY